jgi:hypothetical protein
MSGFAPPDVWVVRATVFLGLLALWGCASSNIPVDSRSGPIPWTPGEYDLRATVSYRMDTEARSRVERTEYTGELIVDEYGSLTFRSSSGLCRRPTPVEVAEDHAQWRRTFSCQEVTYYLSPSAGTVGGSVVVSVQEGFRTRGPCILWETTATGNRVCVEYRWDVDYRSTSKRGSLRVTRRG